VAICLPGAQGTPRFLEDQSGVSPISYVFLSSFFSLPSVCHANACHIAMYIEGNQGILGGIHLSADGISQHLSLWDCQLIMERHGMVLIPCRIFHKAWVVSLLRRQELYLQEYQDANSLPPTPEEKKPQHLPQGTHIVQMPQHLRFALLKSTDKTFMHKASLLLTSLLRDVPIL